jgi:hypothetical protein
MLAHTCAHGRRALAALIEAVAASSALAAAAARPQRQGEAQTPGGAKERSGGGRLGGEKEKEGMKEARRLIDSFERFCALRIDAVVYAALLKVPLFLCREPLPFSKS